MVYQYKWGNKSYPVPAQKAGEYLHKMDEEMGGVTPARVLDASRAEGALLHRCFEWDDSKAAEAHRLYQARKLIGNLVCTVYKEEDTSRKEAIEVRAFVNTAAEAHAERGVFKPVISALSDEDSRRIVLENAKRDLVHFRDKYSSLSELSDVIEAINRVVA